ncbi:MAG: lysine--tRNA ligase [Phycisphaeraceae bacterium]|nr:lysine--tRNA ligase [Phycisphaeraceae bacterium]
MTEESLDESQGRQPGDLVADRRRTLARLRDELGIDPFGRRIDGLISLADARARFDAAADEAHKLNAEDDRRPVVHVAGRIVQQRLMGNLIFLRLRDAGGDLQIAVSKRSVDAPTFNLAKLFDLGDVIVARGAMGSTKTGEVTVWVGGEAPLSLAVKSLAPPPGKWHGLQDAETRYRKRYVDMYANPEVIEVFQKRSRIVAGVRQFLIEHGFMEVETPMLQPIAGGAAAKPFVTHHNALDIDLYLRIAPELYLKRLLVGGMPRVFEINRNFRNEGIDRSHNPEFTMLELYQAFGDYHAMMDLTERMLNRLALDVAGNAKLPYGDLEISYALPFRRAKYHDLFAEVNGYSASDHDKLVAQARTLHIDPAGKDHDVLLNAVWEETVEATLIQPTFVMDYPASLCPLTRTKPDNPAIAERFELFIANMECGNAYTELNDPDAQKANFERQIAGLDDEESTFRSMDHDFIEALLVGMPPAGGLGIGIDRVVMLLTNSRSIRDVILFPLLRPQG